MLTLLFLSFQVTKELYGALEGDSQCEILSTLFDVCVDTKHLSVANLIRKTLKHVSLYVNLTMLNLNKSIFNTGY